MTPVDWVYAGILLVSLVWGMYRGLIREAMALAGWVIAAVLTYHGSGLLAPFFGFTGLGPMGQGVVAGVVVFVLSLVLWSLLGGVLHSASRAVGLGAFDILGGAIFGALRGALILIAINAVVLHTPLASTEVIKSATGVQSTAQLTQQIKPYLPATLAQLLP